MDLLDIEPIPGALVLPGKDFTRPFVQNEIIRLMTHDPLTEEREVEEENEEDKENIIFFGPRTEDGRIEKISPEIQEMENIKIFDVLLSDMAPNATGFGEQDHYRIVNLFRHAMEFALKFGKKQSSFIGKLWDGSEVSKLLEELKTHYKFVKSTKPNSTRNNSSELFICCKGKLTE